MAKRTLLGAPLGAGTLCIAVGVAQNAGHAGAPMQLVAGLVAIALGAFVLAIVRRDHALATVTFLGVAAGAPVFGYHARRAVEHALDLHDTLGIDYLEIEVVLPSAAFLATVSAVMTWAVARAVRPASLDRALRAAAFVGAAAGALVVVGSALRSAKLPDPESYVASLPVVARLGPLSGVDPNDARRSRPPEDTVASGLVVRRACNPEFGCTIQVASSASSLRDDHGWFVPGVAGETVVRRDARHGTVVLDTAISRMWLDADTGSYARAPEARDVVGPPLRWVLGGATGVVVAVVALALGARAGRRASVLARGLDGHFDGTLVRFDDGSPPLDVPGPLRAVVPRGPVVVLASRPRKEATFRDPAPVDAREVVPGTRVELVDRAHAVRAARSAYAIASVAIACAPLVAA